ncbi:MAG: polysaccharide biosynthesis protein [Clostridia bacterium]|nr:polysaccharide biosynthesis protein [Clostridia bacterium]
MNNNIEKKTQNKEFIKGAVWIASGAFISKLIGALYRIPLTNLIGGHGIGLYQMIYPFYCLLLTVSATGIPSSISAITAKEVSKGKAGRRVLGSALKVFITIGALGSALMIILARPLASAQGETALIGGYITLAPSVLLVSIISVFRGWFQGNSNMRPTAISEILEQLVKVAFGLLFAYLYRGDVEKSVKALLFAVTISEVFALFYMLIQYKRTPAPMLFQKDRETVGARRILKTSAFVTLASAMLPLSNMIESIFLVRLMSAYTDRAVGLYGLYAGGAVTIINLPVSLCYGVVATTIPTLAKAENTKRRKKLLYSLLITLLVSVPCAIGLYLFAPMVVKIIYRSISAGEQQTLISLIKGFSVSAVTLSCLQTLSGCLTAQGKPKLSAVNTAIGVAVKLGLDFLLVSKSEYSIFGAVIAANVCYALVFVLNLIVNLSLTRKRKSSKKV